MGKQNPVWTDSEIIKAICGTPNEREAALQYFFADHAMRNMVIGYILNHGGTDADGEDVFQEVFVLFDRNIRQGKFRGDSALRTYFMAIAKWYWVSHQRKKKPVVEFNTENHDGEVHNIDAQLINAEHRTLLKEALANIKDKCRELLLLSSMATNEEVAQEKGFSSTDMAKKALYKCREKFRAHIKEHPHLEKLLKSIIKE